MVKKKVDVIEKKGIVAKKNDVAEDVVVEKKAISKLEDGC